MSFSGVTTRANGNQVTAAWFNDLKTAGVALEGFTGSGYIGETSFTVANNQSSAADVTGLLIASASYKGVLVTAEIRRKTSTTELIAVGTFALIYRDLTSTWEIAGENWKGDEHGVTLSVTAGGQVQYASTNVSGTGYVGTMKFRAMSFAA